MPRRAWNKRLAPEIERFIIARHQAGFSTDGEMSRRREGGQPQIGLQLVDRELPEKFSEFPGSKNPPTPLRQPPDRHQPICRAVVNSRPLAADREPYGVVPRKRSSTSLPIVSPAFRLHRRPGISDGDGPVSHREDGKALIGYAGSESLIVELRIWLICTSGISDHRIHKNGATGSVQWWHRSDVQNVVRSFYGEADA